MVFMNFYYTINQVEIAYSGFPRNFSFFSLPCALSQTTILYAYRIRNGKNITCYPPLRQPSMKGITTHGVIQYVSYWKAAACLHNFEQPIKRIFHTNINSLEIVKIYFSRRHLIARATTCFTHKIDINNSQKCTAADR